MQILMQNEYRQWRQWFPIKIERHLQRMPKKYTDNVRTSLSTDVILEDENSVQSFVLNPGCCPRFRWSHVLLNHRSTAPVNRHFVKSAAPRGQRVVKSALNPGYSRVKPPLCPGGRGAGVSIDWCIINSWVGKPLECKIGFVFENKKKLFYFVIALTGAFNLWCKEARKRGVGGGGGSMTEALWEQGIS